MVPLFSCYGTIHRFKSRLVPLDFMRNVVKKKPEQVRFFNMVGFIISCVEAHQKPLVSFCLFYGAQQALVCRSLLPFGF